MKLFLVFFISMCTLLACTSEESQIKEAAIAAANLEMREELTAQVRQRIQGKNHLQDTFVNQVLERTEFEVDSVEASGDKAKVQLLIKTVPARVQDGVIDIISNLDPSKERAFNVADGIDLVTQKMNLDRKTTLNQKRTLLLKKDKQWKAEKSTSP